MPDSMINRFPLIFNGESVLIGTANELAIALDVLQGQSDHEALIQLEPHLTEIIGNANGLMTVIRSLSLDNQIFLIQVIGPDLGDVIQNAACLRDILAVVSDPRMEITILTTLGSSGLRSLLETGPELSDVLEWVYGECDSLVIDLLGKDYFRRLMRSASDLSNVLRNVDTPLQARILEHLGWSFVVNLVKDGYDLAYLLRTLPPVNSDQLLHHFSGQQLISLIGNRTEWNYLYQRLEPAEADMLLSRIKSY